MHSSHSFGVWGSGVVGDSHGGMMVPATLWYHAYAMNSVLDISLLLFLRCWSACSICSVPCSWYSWIYPNPPLLVDANTLSLGWCLFIPVLVSVWHKAGD